MKKWTLENIKSPLNKKIIITGASSGIGLAAANTLARKGAEVIAAVRNLDKAKQVLDSSISIKKLDLTDLDSVAEFANSIKGKFDILINNAGVMAVPFARTKQGFEMQFGTNHLGHFALTGHLISQIEDRVVTVSSTAHKMGKMNFSDLNFEKKYRPWLAYGQSKLSNLLFTAELQRRLALTGSPVRAMAVHPGYSDTNLQSQTKSSIQDRVMGFANRVIAQPADQGSWPTLFAATEDIAGNSFVGPDGFAEIKGYPKLVGRTKRAQNMEDAYKLWEISEELTKVRFLDFPKASR